MDTPHQLQVSTDKVEVRVQLVKPDYLIVSLPVRKPANPPTLGFVSTKDYNLLGSAAGDAARRFSVGQTLQASVAQLPTEETGKLPNRCTKTTSQRNVKIYCVYHDTKDYNLSVSCRAARLWPSLHE